ncbi:MAG: hypothetical protein AAFP69_11560 [Planctomycetota bacterium]
MVIDESKVQILVCPPIELEKLCFPPQDEVFPCHAISRQGVRKLTNNTNKPDSEIWLQPK